MPTITENFGEPRLTLVERMTPLLDCLSEGAQLCVQSERICEPVTVAQATERERPRNRRRAFAEKAQPIAKPTEWFRVFFAQDAHQLGSVACASEQEAQSVAARVNEQMRAVLASERRKCTRALRTLAPQVDAARRDLTTTLSELRSAATCLSRIDDFRLRVNNTQRFGHPVAWSVCIDPHREVILKGSEQERRTIQDALNAILVPLVELRVKQLRDELVKMIEAEFPDA